METAQATTGETKMNSHKTGIECAAARIKEWKAYVSDAEKDGNAAKAAEGKARLEFAVGRLEFAMRA